MNIPVVLGIIWFNQLRSRQKYQRNDNQEEDKLTVLLWKIPYAGSQGNRLLKDTLTAFDDFKNEQKGVWSHVFWYVKSSILWKCIQYTI